MPTNTTDSDRFTTSLQRAWWAHLRGECEQDCEYCRDEEEEEDPIREWKKVSAWRNEEPLY